MSETAAAPAAASSSPAPSSAPSPAPAADASPVAGAPSTPTSGSTPAAAPAPKPEPRRHKLKIDGEDLEVDEEELKRGYQRSAAAAKRFEEAARRAKELEAKEAALKKRLEDPRVLQAAQQWGIPPEDAAAVLRAQELMEREQMDPAQRALMEERQRREEAERKIKEHEEQQGKAKLDAETQAEIGKLNREVIEAADKLGLPKSPRLGRMMLQHMHTMAQAGMAPDAHESARFVMDSLKTEVPHLIGGMGDEQIVSFLGKPVIDRILAWSVARARGQAPATPAPAPTPQGEPQRRPLTIEEWRAKHAP